MPGGRAAGQVALPRGSGRRPGGVIPGPRVGGVSGGNLQFLRSVWLFLPVFDCFRFMELAGIGRRRAPVSPTPLHSIFAVLCVYFCKFCSVSRFPQKLSLVPGARGGRPTPPGRPAGRAARGVPQTRDTRAVALSRGPGYARRVPGHFPLGAARGCPTPSPPGPALGSLCTPHTLEEQFQPCCGPPGCVGGFWWAH